MFACQFRPRSSKCAWEASQSPMAHSCSRRRTRSRSRSRSHSHSRPGKKRNRKRSSSSSSSSSQARKYKSTSQKPQQSSTRKNEVHTKKEKAMRKRSISSSSSSRSSSSSTEDSSDSDSGPKKRSHSKKKHKDKKGKKKKKKKSKKQKKKTREAKSQLEDVVPGPSLDQWQREALAGSSPALTDEQKSRIQAMKPMTKEEWDKKQSIIRRVLDPETGRTRLIKGDGEILEEIVSKERHKEINKQATHGDGLAFEMQSGMLR
uniref:ADP-ribosylation factor-like protein 6-interacting protein 4 n=2 Tax=Geotrypetes seraphini TaxID=260995 RepID=A0A6P8S554_GEOSA|nr:ADP-ribosylation factor-like protein 6-interacting protein 4 isoform X1 [Geotrypetes seraphini]